MDERIMLFINNLLLDVNIKYRATNLSLQIGGVASERRMPPPASNVCNQRKDEDNEEYEKQDFGDTGRARCNPGETKNSGDYCDDEKNSGPVQHDVSPRLQSIAGCGVSCIHFCLN
jgi:hypothetical protein